MDIIVPTTITDAMLDFTNVLETDYNSYQSGTTYGDGDTVMSLASGVHRIYESLQAGNTGNALPVLPATSTAWWLEISATNRWKCVDSKWGTQTTNATTMQYVLSPGAIDSAALLNMDADSAVIRQWTVGATLVTNGAFSGVTGWTAYHSSTPVFSSGWMEISDGGADSGAYQTIVTEASTWYEFTAQSFHPSVAVSHKISVGSSGAASTDLYTITQTADGLGNVLKSGCIFQTGVGGTSTTITLQRLETKAIRFDNIVLRKLTNIYSTTVALGAANPVTQITDVAKVDLVSNASAILDVTLSYSGGTAKLGMLIVGTSQNLGSTLEKPGISFTDYSVWTDDGNGNFTITAGAYAKKMNAVVSIANTSVDGIARALAYYRATAVVYVADDTYSSLIIYGFMKAFDLVFTTKDYSIYSCRVEGKI